MHMLYSLLTLLSLISLVQGQQVEPKPLWGKPLPASSRLLVTSPDGTVIFVLKDVQTNSDAIRKVIIQYQTSDGKELKSCDLEAIDAAEYSSRKDGWKQVKFDASPDGQTLIATIDVPYSMTKNNVYGHRHLQLYDLQSGRRKGDLIKKVVWLNPGHFAEESSSCFSPDGKCFWGFNVGYGEQFDVYSCDSGKVVYSEKCQRNERSPLSMAFSENGKLAAIFYQGKNNSYAVSIHSWPDGKKLKDIPLPTGKYWQSIHSWHGNRILVEEMVEDEQSKPAPSQMPAARPIQAWKRVCHSLDLVAEKPLESLKEVTHIAGFHGRSLGLPMVYWDMGRDWSARITQHVQTEEVIQAATFKKQTLAYYYWRDVQVLDAGTGTELWQRRNVPWQSQISRTGSYLVAAGASPEFPAGLYVWTLPKRP